MGVRQVTIQSQGLQGPKVLAMPAMLDTVSATFVYDGDGKRVAQTVNGVTTYFIGNYFEVTNPGAGQTVTKYYFAGSTRIAMRKYVIPQSMSVEYFLGDHLGSTSITTDSSGAKVSEMRYKPWGEVRSWWTAGLSTTPAYKLPDYTFTGQYSHMDDPSTTEITEGFGLMYYNARWYDPYPPLLRNRYGRSWAVVERDIPELKFNIQTILKSLNKRP